MEEEKPAEEELELDKEEPIKEENPE